MFNCASLFLLLTKEVFGLKCGPRSPHHSTLNLVLGRLLICSEWADPHIVLPHQVGFILLQIGLRDVHRVHINGVLVLF